MNVKSSLLIITAASLLLTACGDNPFNDNTPIKDTNYAEIRLEIERCNHVDKEGSFLATLRWSPKMSCLKHLRGRIVTTGKATNEGLNDQR